MFRSVSALCRLNLGATLRQSQARGAALTSRPFGVSSATRGSSGDGFHHTSNLDKRILVWTKMYPSLGEVPHEVTQTKMKKAKDVFRIRCNLLMAFVTVILAGVYIWRGKQAVGRGENIHQQNKDRHHEFRSLNK